MCLECTKNNRLYKEPVVLANVSALAWGARVILRKPLQ